MLGGCLGGGDVEALICLVHNIQLLLSREQYKEMSTFLSF